MTVDEAMEEFRKIVTGHPVILCDCDTCDGWLPKVRRLFVEVHDAAYKQGELAAYLDSLKISLGKQRGGKE